MGFAACFGSPLLMNVIGVGCALSIRMLVTAGAPVAAVLSKQCRLAYLFLYIALLSHLFAFPIGSYRVPRTYGACAIAWYGCFLVASVLLETRLINLDWLLCWSVLPACPAA